MAATNLTVTIMIKPAGFNRGIIVMMPVTRHCDHPPESLPGMMTYPA